MRRERQKDKTEYYYFEVNFQPLRDGLVQVRVGRDEDILVVSDIVRHRGGSDVGELGSGDGQAAVEIHRD